MSDYHVMLRNGPGRNDETVSIGELKAQDRLTSNEVRVLRTAYDLEDGFTYDELRQEERPETEASVTHGGPVPGVVQHPDRVAKELQGTLGSLVNKGLIERETYTDDDIETFQELEEEHGALIKQDEIEDPEEYGGLLNKRGGIYTRDSHGIHVDDSFEAGQNYYFLTGDAKDIAGHLE